MVDRLRGSWLIVVGQVEKGGCRATLSGKKASGHVHLRTGGGAQHKFRGCMFYSILRPLWSCRLRVLRKLFWNFMFRGAAAIRRFEKRRNFFPPFMMLSITSGCQYRCRGCWVLRAPADDCRLTPEQIRGVIRTCRRQGSHFFGILGGEPLLYPGLLDLLAEFPDCYFQVFTNGKLLTAEVAERMARLGHITPLISIEGLPDESGRRRGHSEAFDAAVQALDNCRRAGLFFGAAASVCHTNFAELVTPAHLQFLAGHGAHYLWYYIYRPVGPCPEPENALASSEIYQLRRFLAEQRPRAPLLLIDAYWDHQGRGLCPAAVGLSHHIGPDGALEFCPPLQFAREYLNADGSNLEELLNRSEFLARLRRFAATTSHGCPILENPQGLLEFMRQEGAFDSSGRGRVYAEFAAMSPLPSHDQPDLPVPERSFLYRWAKKLYFFGFGAYG